MEILVNLTIRRASGATALLLAGSLVVAACGSDADDNNASGSEGNADAAGGTVTIEDNHGTVEVPLDAERVVATDNTGQQTLADWDIELVAAPKPLFRFWPEYAENNDVLDLGNHREPNLENLVAAEPDLIINGQRFGGFYDDISSQNPDATIVELTAREGEDHADELKRQTTELGKIFGHEEDAEQIVADFESAIEDAAAAYPEGDTVIGLMTSGGEILYVAPVDGRGLGVLFPTLGLDPAIEVEASDTSHGDDISVEAIADANPDWLIVLDRDALMEEDGYVPATDLIENSEALQNVTAVQEGQIVYTSAEFYLTEGIQAYTDLYRSLADAFEAAN